MQGSFVTPLVASHVSSTILTRSVALSSRAPALASIKAAEASVRRNTSFEGAKKSFFGHQSSFVSATPARTFFKSSVSISMVKVNEKAPEVSAPDQNGQVVSLKDFLGKKSVVLYFYPKDDTPGCTAESCAFRDNYQVFSDAGAEVIGVSSDTTASHKQFAGKYNLPFKLLADPDQKIRKAFGVPGSLLGLLPGRVTYVIDKEGTVRLVFDSALGFQDHVSESLKIIKQLSTA